MAIIQITPEVLTAKAGEVRRLKATHDETMTQLNSLITGLSESWKGEAQNAFVTKYESMKGSFQKFSEMLEGYAKLMDLAAEEFRNTDEDLSHSMQNFE